MKFINGKLVVVGFDNSNTLSFSGDTKQILVGVESSIELKSSGVFVLNITYKIMFNSLDGILINKLIAEYNYEIEKDNKSIYDGREIIYNHLRNGLILSLNKVSNNDTSLATEVLPTTNLHGTTETIVNALIQLDFYGE